MADAGCLAPGCTNRAPWFCTTCWPQLPLEQRRRIDQVHRSHGATSSAFIQLIAEASNYLYDKRRGLPPAVGVTAGPLIASPRIVGESSRRPGSGPTVGTTYRHQDPRTPEQRKRDTEEATARAVAAAQHLKRAGGQS